MTIRSTTCRIPVMGRPQKFDREHVLERIMLLFWERGYAGTSLSDILAATGLRKGSLYRSFGNKEELFSLALDRYCAGGIASLGWLGPSLDSLLRIYSRMISNAGVPERRRRGCLVFNASLEFGEAQGRSAEKVRGRISRLEDFFRASIRQAVKAGELPRGLDEKAAAARVFASVFAMREMSKFKPEKTFLREIANGALASLGTGLRV